MKEQMVAGYLERIEAYATERNLTVKLHSCNEGYEPAWAVALHRGSPPFDTEIIRRTSREGVGMAAFYLTNALELLGAPVPASNQPGERP